MRRKALVLATLGSVYASSLPAQAPTEPPPGAAPADILSFEHRGSLMAVPVKVTGRGPYAFLVDSGAERTVISKELVQLLALRPGKDVRIHTMTEATTLSTAHIPHLQVSKRQVNDIQAPALPAEYIGAAGVLGVDSLRRQRVVFDFVKRTMTITPSRQPVEVTEHDTIVVSARSRYGRLVIANVVIDGENAIAVIDTGSEISLGNKALQTRLARRNRLRPTVPLDAWSITGSRFTVDYTQLRRMTVGNLSVTNMPVGFADAHIFRQLRLDERPAVMLGMDALRLFAKVSVDFARKEVRFELPRRGSDTALALAD